MASVAEISVAAALAATGSSRRKASTVLEKSIDDVIAKLQSALGDRLLSVILFGSAAMGDFQQQRSDFNLLCVVTQLGVEELGRCGPIFRAWREQGNPAPLLLTAEEVRTSTDCFPMEFQDMSDHRQVLYGEDVIAQLPIDRSFYRAQVEHELRSKQIRLRQIGADLLSTPERLGDLMADSLSTFCVLGRHALVLSGREPKYKKAEILAALESAMERKMKASSEILAVRSTGKKNGVANAAVLFEAYLGEMDSLVRFVDALER